MTQPVEYSGAVLAGPVHICILGPRNTVKADGSSRKERVGQEMGDYPHIEEGVHSTNLCPTPKSSCSSLSAFSSAWEKPPATDTWRWEIQPGPDRACEPGLFVNDDISNSDHDKLIMEAILWLCF